VSRNAPQPTRDLDAGGLRIGIVVSRFNAEITEALLAGARAALESRGGRDVRIFRVPGALEIGTVAARMAQSGRFDAIVCLGCVIRGDTAHFEHVSRVCMDMIGAVALRGDVGVGNGVLTVDSVEQARERVGGACGHKGEEAALTAVEVAHLLKTLER